MMVQSNLIGLLLLLVTTLTQAAPCSWNNPGNNPYRGDMAKAVDHYALPSYVAATIKDKIKNNNPDDVVIIDRNDIYGQHTYNNLRAMHFGAGQVCETVDRSQWGDRMERAKVYCADQWCVIVPQICGNVSLVDMIPPNPTPLRPSGDGGGIRVFSAPEPIGLTLLALLGVGWFHHRKHKH